MRRIKTSIVFLALFASLNVNGFEGACNASSKLNPSSYLNGWIGAAGELKAAQKQKAKKRSTQSPSSVQGPEGVPSGVSGGVPGGVPGGPGQAPPSITRKSGGSFEKSAVKRVQPAYPPLAKAARVSGTVVVEVVVNEAGDVISMRAISGHPLLRDEAAAAARQWEFTPTELSGKPVKVIGTLTFTFSLGDQNEPDSPPVRTLNEEEARKINQEEEKRRNDSIWQENLKVFQEQSAKKSPDNKKLAMAMANMASAAIDAERFAEALQLFEDAEQQNRLPAEVRPYYGELIEAKLGHDQGEAIRGNRDDYPEAEQVLTKVLDLYVQAFNDESKKRPVDGRLLFDLASHIYYLSGSVSKAEDKEAWLKKMLDMPGLSERDRAAINYALGVEYWQRAYEISLPYTRKRQRVPDQDLVKMRVEVQRGFEYILKAHSIDPQLADAYFYEKLLWIEEAKIERDPQKKKAIEAKQQQTQDRYMSLIKSRYNEPQQGAPPLPPITQPSDLGPKPYASGLPSLRAAGFGPPPLPPPPPPPPPPAAAPRRVTPQKRQRATAQRSPRSNPLMTAVKSRNLASVRTLLARGADVNAADQEGKTALMEIAGALSWTESHSEIFRALLDKGAEVNAADKDRQNGPNVCSRGW